MYYVSAQGVVERVINVRCYYYYYYQIITGTAPQYLADLVQFYVPSRSLRSSSDDRTFRIPTFKGKQHGGRAFLLLFYKPGILSHLLSVLALIHLPSKLVRKLTFSHSILISNNSWGFFLPRPPNNSVIVCACECLRVCVCVCLSVCVLSLIHI